MVTPNQENGPGTRKADEPAVDAWWDKPSSQGKPSVLIVEPGTGPRRLRRALSNLQEFTDVRIEAAGSADLARAMLRLRTFDALVVDAQTPRLAEALSGLRAEPRASAMPFIVAGEGTAPVAMRGVSWTSDADLARRLREALHMRTAAPPPGEAPSELAALLSATKAALLAVDATGACIFANAAVADLFGCAGPGELIGRPVTALVPDDLVRAGRGDILRFDGHLAYVGVTSSHPGPGAGRITEVLTITDLKHERAREARLFSAQKTMAIGELTSGICHDFANLLTIVCGNLAEIAKCRDLAPDVKDMAQDALSAAVDGMNLTRRLVAVARERQTRVRAVDIGLTLGEFGRLLKRLVRRPVELEVATEEGVHAMLDRTQLESAVMNLVLNSQYAMPNGGKILLSVDMAVDNRSGIPEPMARIVVSDEGVGMSEEALHRATEPFFTTRADSGGTGLGLAMVADFVKAFAGHLDIRSAPGKGTRVTLMFPWVAEASPRTQVFALEAEEKRAATRRALVVDPEPRIRRYAARLLGGVGHQVVEAADATSAAQILAEQPDIALVMVDQHVAMQRVGRASAADLAHWITTYRPRVELVITTSDEAPPDSELAGLRFLRKPYSEAELGRTLRSFATQAGR
jgi:signal transduction histidine kinase